MEDKIVQVRARLREKINDLQEDLKFYQSLLEAIDVAFPSQKPLQAPVEERGTLPAMKPAPVTGTAETNPQPAPQPVSENMWEMTVTDKNIHIKLAQSIEVEMLPPYKRRYLNLFFEKIRELDLMADAKPSGKLIEEIVVTNYSDDKEVDEITRLTKVVLAKVLS